MQKVERWKTWYKGLFIEKQVNSGGILRMKGGKKGLIDCFAAPKMVNYWNQSISFIVCSKIIFGHFVHACQNQLELEDKHFLLNWKQCLPDLSTRELEIIIDFSSIFDFRIKKSPQY